MSEEMTKVQFIAAMRKSYKDFVLNTLAGAKGDVKVYAELLAQEFGRYLTRAATGDDPLAERNLKHLGAQVALLAVKRSIIVTRDAMARLKEATLMLFAFGVRALVAL